MGALNGYLQQVERFCRDGGQGFLNPADLIDYVNRARRELAGRTQCIRVLGSISSGISTITVDDGGTGYTAADTLTISPPDSPSGAAPDPSGTQATAGFTVDPVTGAISAVSVINGGSGYFAPTATITSATGSGASLSVQTAPLSATIANQEIYQFSAMDLSGWPGVGEILAVRDISVLYANYRYTCLYYAFSQYQAFIRQYPRQYYYVPTVWSQFGQGAAGSVYMYPVASAAYQMEWDAICLPADLTNDNDVEAIPLPWTDAVPYFAAHLAFAEMQNLNASMAYLKLYDEMVHRYSVYARPGKTNNPYGRY